MAFIWDIKKEFNPLKHNVANWSDTLLKILPYSLQDF